MSKAKKRFITLIASAGLVLSVFVVSGLMVSTPKVYSEIPEPNCVCDGCGYTCGSGHASHCIYKPK